MKITLAAFGQDLLKVLSVVTIVAKAAEPVIDLSNPGIANVYNLSADEAVAVVSAYLGLPASSSAAPAAASTPAAPAAPAPSAEGVTGPGLAKTVAP